MAGTVEVVFYKLSKKRNSTKRPASSARSATCALKDPCSILNPVLLLETSNPATLNYAYIEKFKRYYWITNMVSDHGMWEIHLQVDALATWRTEIRASSQYVDRADQNVTDNGIIDGKYACTVDTTMENISITGNGASSGTAGSTRPFMNVYRCMIGATTAGADDGVHPQTISGTAYYCLTPAKAEHFIRYLLDDPQYLSLNVDEISDSLAKGIINPIEYIGESYILPYELLDKDLPTSNTSACKLYVGWWPVDPDNNYQAMNWSCAFKKLKIWESEQIVLGNHPQSSLFGKYLNCAPYTEIQLYAGPFGYISIDPLLLTKYTALKLVVYGDFKGQAELDILAGGYDSEQQQYVYKLWKKVFCDVKISLPLTQLSSDGLKAFGGAASGVKGMASSFVKNDAFGMIGSAMSGIMSLAGSQVPKQEGSSSMPSTTYMKDDWFVHCEYHMVTDQAPGLKGRPLCEDKILSDIGSGYIQISEPVLELQATPAEISEIEGFMQGGMFLE